MSAGPTTIRHEWIYRITRRMNAKPKFDHCVITVSDWERSNRFYREVLGAELVPLGENWAYRFGDKQLNVHGPGQLGEPMPGYPFQRAAAICVLNGPARSMTRSLISRPTARRSKLARP